MNFAGWSLRNPIPSILFFALLTFAGLYGFKNLHIQDLPDIDLPSVNAELSLPGASTVQLETEVARKVEDSIAAIAGIKHINTTITDGLVSINVQFVLDKNLSDALLETKDAIDRIRSDLPPNLEEPVISADRIGSSALMVYAVSSTGMGGDELSWFTDDVIAKKILSVDGVGKFERIGGTDREIKIEIDPVKLASLNVTAADVSQTLKSVQTEASGGRSRLDGQEQLIRTVTTVSTAPELSELVIPSSDGRTVRLEQVARVLDTHAERSQLSLLDGKEVVGFNVYRAKGADEVKIAGKVHKALARLEKEHPEIKLTQVNNTVNYTITQYEGSMSMLYEGALLAVIVVWFFLRDWRATLISATALPLSIIPTYAVMNWLGYSLNTLTLLAQAVVVGILVDDAIVEIENIVRHKRMGKPVFTAVSDAVSEIALAVIATTFTIVAVFLPTSLMEGVGGLFFKQFGWTVVISVLFSLLVARLLTPVMALWFLKDDVHPHKPDGFAMRTYINVVEWCLDHGKTTFALAFAYMVLTYMLASGLSTGFIPASDEGYTRIGIELPPGSSIEQSRQTAEELRGVLGDVKGIANVFCVVGESGNSGETDKSSMTLVFTPMGERPSQTEIENAVRQKLKLVAGARFSLGSENDGLNVIFAGDNADALNSTVPAFEKELRTLGYLNNIKSTASLQKKEIIVRPNIKRSAELGVTASDIALTLRVATAGDYDSFLAKLNLDNRQVYIRTYMSDADVSDLSVISNLRIPARDGSTALSNIAEISTGNGPSVINRYDRMRYVTVSADIGTVPLGKAIDDAKALPSMKHIPDSVQIIDGGDAELMNELFSGFGVAMLTGILCMYCVLVLLFKDFLQPVSILSALPLSIGGSVAALILSGAELSLVALIGMVMLMGIVTKNSILLADYAIMNMKEHDMPLTGALLDACHKRAQPIVMTTVAMIAGMMPIMLGFGDDASFRRPMAFAVTGGLLTSTFLSLLIVPVVFKFIHETEKRLFVRN